MTVKGTKGIIRSLEKLSDNLEDEVTDVAEDALDETERGAKRRVVQNDAVATTDLYRGFKQARHPIQHARGPGTRLRLTNTEPHAKFVEWGTGDYFGMMGSWGYKPPETPYRAPSMSVRLVAAIAEWIAIKPGFRRSGPPREMAYPIAKSISTRTERDPMVGTSAQPFMRPSWFVVSRGLYTRFRAAVGRAVRRS